MYQQYLADIIEQITWAPIPPIALRLFWFFYFAF
jgi:hypothetical protein